eukprot:scaffold25943_cov79-Isochrysis_galbana.AAC.1
MPDYLLPCYGGRAGELKGTNTSTVRHAHPAEISVFVRNAEQGAFRVWTGEGPIFLLLRGKGGRAQGHKHEHRPARASGGDQRLRQKRRAGAPLAFF